MKKNKAKKTYLKIPENFEGFTYKELETRLAVMELKRDMMKQRVDFSIDKIRGRHTSKNEVKQSTGRNLLNLFANGFYLGKNRLFIGGVV